MCLFDNIYMMSSSKTLFVIGLLCITAYSTLLIPPQTTIPDFDYSSLINFIPSCRKDADCLGIMSCVNNKCVSSVKICNKLCIIGTKCVNGQCVQIKTVDDCYYDSECGEGKICEAGKCILSIKPMRCGQKTCKANQKCLFNLCIDKNIFTPKPSPSPLPIPDPEEDHLPFPLPFPLPIPIPDPKENPSPFPFPSPFPIPVPDPKEDPFPFPYPQPKPKPKPIPYPIDQCKLCKESQICGPQRKCVDLCTMMLCPSGFVCKNGACKPQKQQRQCEINEDCDVQQRCDSGVCRPGCSLVRCKSGTKCVHGDCISIIEEPDFGTETYCSNPRPDEQTCQTLFYIRAPDLTNCIIDQNGNYKAYARQCEICKDKSVKSYTITQCKEKSPFNWRQFY